MSFVPLRAMTVQDRFSSGHLEAMANAVHKVNTAQKGANNNIPHKMDMNYREVPSSTKDDTSPCSVDYDVVDPDSPAAQDIRFKYDNDRIQNDLLDEICSDIGIKDSMDLDFFDFDTNPGQEIRIQTGDDSLDETIVFSDLPELKGDFLELGSTKTPPGAHVSSTSDIKPVKYSGLSDNRTCNYSQKFIGDKCRPEHQNNLSECKVRNDVPRRGSPVVPDSSGEDGGRLKPARQESVNSIDSGSAHGDNPSSVHSCASSVDSLPGSPAVRSPAMPVFHNDNCRTPTKGNLGKFPVSNSLGSPHVTSTCHRHDKDGGIGSPANYTQISDNIPSSPGGNHQYHPSHDGITNLTDDELFKRPFSPLKHYSIHCPENPSSHPRVPGPYQQKPDGVLTDISGNNVYHQQSSHGFNRSASSPAGQWNKPRGVHQNMSQGINYDAQNGHAHGSNLYRVHEMSNSAPCLANGESHIDSINNRPGSNGPPGYCEQPGKPYFPVSGKPNSVNSFSTRSLDSPSDQGYFSTGPSSVQTNSSHYGSNSSLNSASAGFAACKNNENVMPPSPHDPQQHLGIPQGRFGPFKTGTDLVNQMRQKFAPVFGVETQEGAISGHYGNNMNGNQMNSQMAPMHGSRKILSGPTQMNRMEYSPYPRGPQVQGTRNEMPPQNQQNFSMQPKMGQSGMPGMPSNMSYNMPQQQGQYGPNGSHMDRSGPNDMAPVQGMGNRMPCPSGAIMQNGMMHRTPGMNQMPRQPHMQDPMVAEAQFDPQGMSPALSQPALTGNPHIGVNPTPMMNPSQHGPPSGPMHSMNSPHMGPNMSVGNPSRPMGPQSNAMQPNMQNVPQTLPNGMGCMPQSNMAPPGPEMDNYGFPGPGQQNNFRPVPQGPMGEPVEGMPGGTQQQGCLRNAQQGFMQRLVMSEGSSAFRSHPLFPLLRDLIIADMNFHTPNFPFQLISNLPTDFNRLLQNYLNRNPPAGNHRVNEAVENVIMDALKYAHSTLIEKIDQRKIQQQNQDLPKHLSAIEDFCDRFDKAVRNTMNPVPQSHYGAVAGASIPIPPTSGTPPNRNPVAPPTPKKQRRGDIGDFSSPLKPGSDAGSCPGTPGSNKGDGPSKGKKHPVLPKEAVAVMLEWLKEHKDNPYPNDDEKQMLIQKTKLTINQINYWFTNARRRILPKWALQQYMEQQGYADSQSS